MKKKILFIVLALIIISSMTVAFTACNEDSGMDDASLYLKFDEDGGSFAVDSSGNYEDAKIDYYLTTATFKQPESPRRRNGVENTALWFDGWSTYITYDNYVLPESFTISVWIAPRSWEYPDGQVSAIASKYSRSNKEGFLFGYHDYGSWSFMLGTGSKWVVLEDENNKLERFEWTHLAVSYDNETGNVAIYKNGEIVNSVQLEEGERLQQTTESLIIGRNAFGSYEGDFQTGLFNGLMDEFLITNHSMSRGEVEAVFRKGCNENGYLPECTYDDIGNEAELLRDDMYLPQYHISPASGWMNEPIATFKYKNVYHMFYQSTAAGPYWRYTQWGHWVSEDNVHWREVKPILFPEPDGMADHHVFSGNAVLDANGTPYIIYTGVNFRLKNLNRISYAVPSDLDDPYLTNWDRSDEPLFEQPEDCSYTDFRDPYIYTEGEYAYMIIGTSSALANFRKGNPRTVCYKAHLSDLTNWTYLGISYEANYNRYPYLGYDWELPVMTRVQSEDGMWDKYVLFASPKPDSTLSLVANVYYWLGDFDTETGKFTPEKSEPTRLDFGNTQVLVITNRMENGINTLYGLMNGGQTGAQVKASGWTNYVTLGKTLSLNNETGELQFTFDKAYETLHSQKLVGVSNTTVESANAMINGGGDMLHIKVEFDVSNCESAGLLFRKSSVNEFMQQEYTTLKYTTNDGRIVLDTTRSGIGSENGAETGGAIVCGDTLSLDIYIDRSCVEIIVNGAYNITYSIRPTLADATGIELIGDAHVKSLEVYTMEGTR